MSEKADDDGLTRSAFVPDNEVFTAARTLVRPKHTAVDKDLTAPSVLALVQHFLKKKSDTEQKRTKDSFRGRTINKNDGEIRTLQT